MMRIVLAYIDNHKKILGHIFSDEWLISKAADLPLGLASIRAYSRQDPLISNSCQFYNRIFSDTQPLNVMVKEILSHKPDIVCFSTNLWNFENTKLLAKSLKNKMSEIKVVFGGPMVPDDIRSNKKMLQNNTYLDAIIRGEGEIAFKKLLKFYLKLEKLSSIPNTSLRERNEIFTNKNKLVLKDLSEIPSPYLSGDVSIKENATGLLALETSRGCIYDCAYCRYHGGERPRFFNIDRFKGEVALLKEKNFKGTVFLTDPLLNANKEWAKNILHVLENCAFKICIDIRPDLIDDEMILMFTKIPALEFSVGMQSINPTALKNINRPINIKKCRESIIKLEKSGIHTGIDLIMGLPGDNYESFKKTIDWVVYCKAEQVDINDLIIIPNSNLEKLAKEFQIKFNDKRIVLSNYTFTEEDMVRASHFKIAFQFLHGFHQNIFFLIVFKFGFKPSKVVETFTTEAENCGEIPKGRLLNLSGISFSDKTVLNFFKVLFHDKSTVKFFLTLFKENSIKLKNNINYKIEFLKNS